MSETETKIINRKLILKTVKAALFTFISGVFWFFVWLFVSGFLARFPQYLTLFSILIWASLFFTFIIRVSEGTIYKYIFIIARAFFLIIYIAYSTNFGVLTINFEGFNFTVEFIPLLAIMVAINLVSIARGLLQAIEFAAQSPED
ncbi:MAG: hypothetical protein QXX79_01525 [Candidatus Bathyarchaeia archaeon]